MDLRTYQERARRTDRNPATDERGLMIPLLGLAGEAGELLTEYKKFLRDGESHRLFRERFAEELGDLLWYLADLATKFGLDLGEVAELVRAVREVQLDDEQLDEQRKIAASRILIRAETAAAIGSDRRTPQVAHTTDRAGIEQPANDGDGRMESRTGAGVAGIGAEADFDASPGAPSEDKA